MLRTFAFATLALTVGFAGVAAAQTMSADEIRARIIKQRAELNAASAQSGETSATRGLKRVGSKSSTPTTGASVSGTKTTSAMARPPKKTATIQSNETSAAAAAYVPPKFSGEAAIDLEVRFAFGSARLDPAARAQLHEICSALKADPGGDPFVIIGHTDAVGPDDYNLTLSQERAKEVVRYLTGSKCGVPSGRLRALGMGEQRLKNTADPKAAENRRVEIQVGV